MNEEAQVETEVESTETEVPATPASESVEEVKAERPDWLPQKFESPEQLSVAYGELEKRHYQRTDDLKKTVAEEMQEQAFADVPEVLEVQVVPSEEVRTVPELPTVTNVTDSVVLSVESSEVVEVDDVEDAEDSISS